MPPPVAIPQDLWPEVQRLSRGGLVPQGIANWLKEHHDVTCSHMAVRRLLERLGHPARTPIAPPPPLPLAPPPPLQSPTTDESLGVLRTEAYREIRVGDKEEDWKRKHSAMRIAIQADAALDRKRLTDLEFQGAAGRDPLSADEEAAAVEAVRLKALAVYDLAPPETMPAPGPGAPLPAGGRVVN